MGLHTPFWQRLVIEGLSVFSMSQQWQATSIILDMVMPSMNWNFIQNVHIYCCRPAKIIPSVCGILKRMFVLQFLAVLKVIAMKYWALTSTCMAIVSCLQEWIIHWNFGVWISPKWKKPLKTATHSMLIKVNAHLKRLTNIFPTIQRARFIVIMVLIEIKTTLFIQ